MVLLLCLATMVTNAQISYHLYARKDKSDLKGAFYAFEEVQKRVRKQVEQGLNTGIVVYVHEGEYPVTRPLQFDNRDGGTDEYSVTYCAWPGDEAVISGGTKVKGWNKENHLWVAEAPALKSGDLIIRNLYRDGIRLTRGRFPNEGEMLKITEVSGDYKNISFNGKLIQTSAPDAEIVVYEYWSIARAVLDQIGDNSVHGTTPLGWIGHSACFAKSGMYAYLENGPEFIDIPGEWYADHTAGKIYYMASEEEDPNKHAFFFPVAGKLLEVIGDQTNPVKNLHFSGIRFAYSNWQLPEFGYNGIQAAHHGPAMKSGVPVYSIPAALDYKYTSGCTLSACTVSQTGSSGIAFGAGCLNNSVESCDIFDISANGIVIGQRDGALAGNNWLDEDWENKADIPVGNRVYNCHIYRCGQELFGAVGIYDAFTQESWIAHNEVHDLPYTGISVGFAWHDTTTSHARSLIEYNRVYDVMKKLADGGCIYTLGRQPGTIIRNNVLYEAHRSRWTFGGAPNNGIFFDQGSSDLFIADNVIYDCSGGPIRFNTTGKVDMMWGKNYYDLTQDKEGFSDHTFRNAGRIK